MKRSTVLIIFIGVLFLLAVIQDVTEAKRDQFEDTKTIYNKTIEDDCKLCVENGTHTYYKTLHSWHAMKSPFFICKSSPELISRYSLVVGVYCSTTDCIGLTTEPIGQVYDRFNIHCPSDVVIIQPKVDSFWKVIVLLTPLVMYIVIVICLCIVSKVDIRITTHGQRPRLSDAYVRAHTTDTEMMHANMA